MSVLLVERPVFPARRTVRVRPVVRVAAPVVGPVVPAWLSDAYRGEPWFPVLARMGRTEIAMALLASGTDPRALCGLRRLIGLDAHIGVALRGLERVGERACRQAAAGMVEIEARYDQAAAQGMPKWRAALNAEAHELLWPLLGGVPVRDLNRRGWAWYEDGTILLYGFDHDKGPGFAARGHCMAQLCRQCHPGNFPENYEWEFNRLLDQATPVRFRVVA